MLKLLSNREQFDAVGWVTAKYVSGYDGYD